MFFGKNKSSLKLVKNNPQMLQGAVYHLIESSQNPRHVKIGSGITKIYLRDEQGEEYLVEGNASKIKESFQPVLTFEHVNGTQFKVKRPIGSLLQNTVLKETTSLTSDEKIYMGHGVTERYFIEKNSNKIIKFIGNSIQIKNILEEQIALKEIVQPKSKIIEKPVIKLIEKTIVKEIVPQIGSQGLKGEKGSVGEKGEKGDPGERGIQGPRGFEGAVGPEGPMGPQGPKGDKGEQGEQGLKGDKGDKGNKGEKGDIGPQGIQGSKGAKGDKGDQGIPGPAGIAGPQGLRGEKGERGNQGLKGDIGPRGIQGKIGPKGDRGEKGDKGDKGDPGTSPVLNASYPLIYKEGTLSIDSEKFTKVISELKNKDVQKVIDKMSQLSTPAGGGAVDIALNGDKIIRSVDTLNFIGNNVTITRRRKNVDIQISGGTGGGPIIGATSGVQQIIAGSGIAITPVGGTGIVQINTVATVKGGPRDIQVRSAIDSQDLQSISNFSILESNDLLVPQGLVLSNTGYIEFSDGTIQTSAANQFYYQENSPPSENVVHGDRWMDSDNGIEYIYIDDGNSQQWVQATNGSFSNPFEFYYQETPPTSPSLQTGARWMDSDNGIEYIYVDDGNSQQWIQPSTLAIASDLIPFFYQETAPSSPDLIVGSRWIDSDTGIEYVYVDDGNTKQWMQPVSSSPSSPFLSLRNTVGTTAINYQSLSTDQYIGVLTPTGMTLILPENPFNGLEIIVKDEYGVERYEIFNNIRIIPNNPLDTIDGNNEIFISNDHGSFQFLYRNGWHIISAVSAV